MFGGTAESVTTTFEEEPQETKTHYVTNEDAVAP